MYGEREGRGSIERGKGEVCIERGKKRNLHVLTVLKTRTISHLILHWG